VLKVSDPHQAAEKASGVQEVSGHDFSRADKTNRMNRALATEGCFDGLRSLKSPFSAACQGPEVNSAWANRVSAAPSERRYIAWTAKAAGERSC
jgi:hypothetical protein